MIKKKGLLWASLISTICIIGFIFIPSVDYCYSHYWCSQIESWLSDFSFILVLLPVVLLLSIITYRMREAVFKKWLKFSFWYIPVYIIFSYFIVDSTPGTGGGWAVPDLSMLASVLIISLFLILYFSVSLIIIIKEYKSSRTR